MSKKLVGNVTKRLADISLIGYSTRELQDLTEALNNLEKVIESLYADIAIETDIQTERNRLSVLREAVAKLTGEIS